MSFLSQLGKIGQIAVSSAAVLAGLGPVVLPLFGSGNKAVAAIATGVNDLTAIGSLIGQIEVALQGKTGPEKFAAAVNLVGPVLRTSNLVTGKKVADEALMQKGITEVTQGIVDVMNSLQEVKA